MIWNQICLLETDSTNRYLKELAVKGAPEGTVVLAKKQSAGRGRMGRSFFSPEEKGIYMSVLLRPDIALERSVLITSMAAVAVAEAMDAVAGVTSQIKWVNDIFLNQKKVCGILTEAGINAEKQSLEYAVLGIGVNVGCMEFPEELKTIATSVSNECGFEVKKEPLVEKILEKLEQWYPTLWTGSFLKESKARSLLLGQEIMVLGRGTNNQPYLAKAVDLDELGHLIIERDGVREVLNSGEVSTTLSRAWR